MMCELSSPTSCGSVAAAEQLMVPDDRLLLAGLKLSPPLDWLSKLTGRSKCPRCERSRKYYCYTCYLPMPELRERLPQVHLPCHVDIIKHAGEVDGKSTAIHAAILAPRHVTVHTYPRVPDTVIGNKRDVLLLYPSHTARTLTDILREQPPQQPPPRSIIVIDGTWRQVKKILNDPRLSGIRHVKLTEHVTTYWRDQQGKPSTYLATIEAIYYLLRQYHQDVPVAEPGAEPGAEPYSGQYDNLLYFYKHFYNMIHGLQGGGAQLKAVRQRVQYLDDCRMDNKRTKTD